jgi:hypothetical protein
MNHNVYSPAIKNFWIDLKEVGTLISLCEIPETKPIHRIRNESLCRSSLVLLCSHLETFFENLIVDVLQFHESNQTPVMNLPTQLRVTQIWQNSPISDSSNSETKFKFISKAKNSIFSDDSQMCIAGSFDSDLNIKGFASPGSREIEKLFNNIGIEGIWQEVKVKSGSDTLRRSLDGFVSRRHNIAHGNSADRPTFEDVKLKIIDMCKLVCIFNEIVFEYLTNTFLAQSLWSS